MIPQRRLSSLTLQLTFIALILSATIQTPAADEPTGKNLPYGKDYFILRHQLQNCRLKFEREKTGRVVFLGGSITNMNGWRKMVCEELQRRFPDTKFDFINAGIPSTGSVPGSFRLKRDVFSKGPVDLLFEEAAVNDTANRINQPTQWTRGMEGIIRHALQLNPRLDIVMMHFVDPAKIKDYHAGKTPAVIAAHEQVAKHYKVNSIHLAKEVAERIKAGQFTWKDDFKNLHPSPFGHRLYTNTITRMFDAAWSKPLTKDAKPQPHTIPEKQLDAFSYTNGHLIDIKHAEPGKGWALDPNWTPQSKVERVGTRPGFVNVPMLVSKTPGAELSFKFKGKAVGLWIIAGPDVGVIEYQIDGGAWETRDQFTRWSRGLHLPWSLVLEDELKDTQHTLKLRITTNKNPKSQGTACRIVKFCVN